MADSRDDHVASGIAPPHSVDLTVVTPMYNEADGIAAFLRQLRPVLDDLKCVYEVIIVDDGSQDDSVAEALSLNWEGLRILSLARNCGHQVALEAGLAIARGTWTVTMDSDGQHPPDLIPRLLTLAQDSNLDVVFTVQSRRTHDSVAKRVTASLYYHTVRILTGVTVANSQADFRLIHRRVLDDVNRIPGDKVLRLLLPSVGYRSTTLQYEVRRRIAGHGRFGLGRQFHLAMSSIVNFSSKPLRLVAAAGLALSLGSAFWLVYVIGAFVVTRTVDGWASVMAAVLVVGGLILLSVSVLGEYVARIHDLLKAHPRYAARFVGEADEGTGNHRMPDSRD